jgi:hypothetical protein
MPTVSKPSVFSFTSLNSLFPKSFIYKMVADLGEDGVNQGRGSTFANKLANFEFDYDCRHCHDNSCWNFSLEKLDVCTP